MCLRLRGEERPTMKEVEMTLQFLRTKKSNLCQGNDEEMQQMQCTGAEAEASCQPLPIDIGDRASIAPQHSQRCYSLEREFISSAELPR